MCDLAYALRPRTYPAAFGLVYNSFAEQPDGETCGAAALRHGLLLGGLMAPVRLLESLLEIRNQNPPGTDDVRLLAALCRLGFTVEQIDKPENQPTADFLEGLRPAMEEEGAFLLPCRNDGDHWICLGAWDGQRAWVIDSSYGDDGTLNISGYKEKEFDWTEWAPWINVVRPGPRWAKQFKDWLPARRALLRMPVDNPACMEANVRIAAQQYLDDAEYGYHALGLTLPGGFEISVEVENEGQDAVLVGGEGEGEGRVLVFRRALGMLTGQTQAARLRRRRRRRSSPVQGTQPVQTPPELVVRADRLHAAQLH